MECVREVIEQRAKLRGKTVRQVVLAPKHMSCLNNTTPTRLVVDLKDDPSFEVAIEILRKPLTNWTKGADHFTHYKERPYWAKGRRGAIIGRHSFYKLGY